VTPVAGPAAPRRRSTIHEVAARAGVSAQTVSRVVNGKGEISAQTRARVQRVIDELRYRPSASARSLVSQRTMTLGLVAHELGGSFLGQAVQAAIEEAHRLGYFFVLAGVGAPPREEPAYVRLLLERRVEGLLFVRASLGDDAELLRALVADQIPLVTIACYAPGVALDVVDVDNRDAGRQATAHLLATGRRRIAQLAGPEGWKAAADRAQGYADALAAAGAAADPALTVRAADWGAPAGYAAARALLARGQRVEGRGGGESGPPQGVEAWGGRAARSRGCPPAGAGFDALFAHADSLAFGALRALREFGRRVPEDVAVVGFDDLPLAAFAEPPLTTIRQPAAEAGRLAVRRLVERLAEPNRPKEVIQLKAELVGRASTGAAPVTAPRSR
jgi:LacI family transcriptional regulator